MRRFLVLLVATAIAGSAIPAAARFVRPRHQPIAPTMAEVAPPGKRGAELRDIDIAFWSRRAGEDSLGAEDRMMAAALLMQRARETGSYGDYLRADTLAREAV